MSIAHLITKDTFLRLDPSISPSGYFNIALENGPFSSMMYHDLPLANSDSAVRYKCPEANYYNLNPSVVVSWLINLIV